MNPKDQSIITEDGQRLSLEDGGITGTEDTGTGLAYEPEDTLEEPAPSTEQKEQTDAPGE